MSSTATTPAPTGKIPKPVMRRLFYTRSKWALGGAIVFSLSSVFLWKTFVVDVKKQKYAEFYANYDVDKEFERLKSVGIYKFVGP